MSDIQTNDSPNDAPNDSSGLPARAAALDLLTAALGKRTGLDEGLGHPALKMRVLPYPLEARPESELREIAAEHYPEFLRLLGAQ